MNKKFGFFSILIIVGTALKLYLALSKFQVIDNIVVISALISAGLSVSTYLIITFLAIKVISPKEVTNDPANYIINIFILSKTIWLVYEFYEFVYLSDTTYLYSQRPISSLLYFVIAYSFAIIFYLLAKFGNNIFAIVVLFAFDILLLSISYW